MYASTIAAIDAALDAARLAGVRNTAGTAYDVAAKLEAEAAELVRNNPGHELDGAQVEIGSEGFRAWYISVDGMGVRTAVESGETFVDGELPSTGVTVTLIQGGRGGATYIFPVN